MPWFFNTSCVSVFLFGPKPNDTRNSEFATSKTKCRRWRCRGASCQLPDGRWCFLTGRHRPPLLDELLLDELLFVYTPPSRVGKLGLPKLVSTPNEEEPRHTMPCSLWLLRLLQRHVHKFDDLRHCLRSGRPVELVQYHALAWFTKSCSCIASRNGNSCRHFSSI